MQGRRCVVAIAAAALLLASGCSSSAHSGDDHRVSASAAPPPLRQVAASTHVHVGTAVDMNALAQDSKYKAEVAAQFSAVTPENVMKWETIEPIRGQYSFDQADQLVAFAKENHQLVRGHTLVWYSQLPSWLSEDSFTKDELRNLLRQHISAEVGHFRGKIWQWDVVNEAFNDDGSLRDTMWLRALGKDYVADAFRWAHQADPKATLFYNDYDIEGINAKSTAAYNLVKHLRSEGVPVQGVGLQGHLDLQYQLPTDVLQNMRRFADLGVQIAVTEADVRMDVPADAEQLQKQASGFGLLLSSCLQVPQCTDFTTWGFTDKYSWVPDAFAGEGAALPLDENFQPKPAWNTIVRDLQRAK